MVHETETVSPQPSQFQIDASPQTASIVGVSSDQTYLIISMVVFWWVAQIAASLLTKTLMSKGGHHVRAMTMTTVVLLTSALLDHSALRVFLPKYNVHVKKQLLSLKVGLRVLPIAIAMVAVKSFTLRGYEFVSISTAHTIKACMPIFIVFMTWAYLGNKPSTKIVMSLMPMLMGAAMAASFDAEFHVLGYLIILGSTVCGAFQNVYTKELMRAGLFGSTDSSQTAAPRSRLATVLELHYVTCVVACGLCIPISIYDEFFYGGTCDIKAVFLPIFLSSALQWVASVCSYTLLSMIAPLSHSVAKIAQRMLLIVVSVGILGNTVTALNVLGICIAFMGVGCYTLVKARERVTHIKVSLEGTVSSSLEDFAKGRLTSF